MSDQPSAPWWATLIAIIITAVVSVLGTVYAIRGGPSVSVPGVSTSFSLVKDTITYIPHILLLFGVLADMFTYQGVYSIPSLVGLLSIPVNYLMKFFWMGLFDTIGKTGEILASAPTPFTPQSSVRMGGAAGDFFRDYDGCNVQGFSFLASPYAPQTLVVTATVFSYYIFDLIMNRGWLNATAAIVSFVVLFTAEMLVIGDCGEGLSKFLRGAMAVSEGLLFGGSAYAIVQALYPTMLPTSAIYPFPKKNAKDLKKNAAGQLVDSDGRPYIQLPNGQAIPNVSDADGQKAWGPLFSATGSGQPATANASCQS
jgi:hypothetical protein